MSVGLITRQSIRRALSNEITADLVGVEICFLGSVWSSSLPLDSKLSQISCPSTNAETSRNNDSSSPQDRCSRCIDTGEQTTNTDDDQRSDSIMVIDAVLVSVCLSQQRRVCRFLGRWNVIVSPIKKECSTISSIQRMISNWSRNMRE